MTGLRLKADGSMGAVAGKDGDVLQFLYGAIGCDLVDIVRARRLPDPYVLVVDDEGILKGLPVNPAASILYGTDLHGQPICGDAVILKEGFSPAVGDMDLLTLGPEDMDAVRRALRRYGIR